ncbi:MAG: Helix-turn-helix domain [Bryobacterales bacterium]|jgi:excisionase family DNA binding protein|nr:Helix-turn-helix domain [Bryobacterales bacterium]
MDNTFVSIEMAARQLCVHVGTMRRWVREGRVPATKVGRKYLIPTSVLEGLAADSQLETGSSEPSAEWKKDDVEILPLWLQFRPQWYRRLYFIANECSLSAGETLTRGMELVLKERLSSAPIDHNKGIKNKL